MGHDPQQSIRDRAYEIWEKEGRPDGEHDRHWSQAINELGMSDPVTGAPLDVKKKMGAVDEPEGGASPLPLPPPD